MRIFVTLAVLTGLVSVWGVREFNISVGDFLNYQSQTTTHVAQVPGELEIAAKGSVDSTPEISVHDTLASDRVIASARDSRQSRIVQSDRDASESTVVFGPDLTSNRKAKLIPGLIGQSTDPKIIALGGSRKLPESLVVDGLNGTCAYDCGN